jgi:hypothetical protein
MVRGPLEGRLNERDLLMEVKNLLIRRRNWRA